MSSPGVLLDCLPMESVTARVLSRKHLPDVLDVAPRGNGVVLLAARKQPA